MQSVSDKFKKELAKPRGADIEIIDRSEGSSHEVLTPSAVRINGAEILIPADATMRVHDISGDELVTVTLTVFVRSLTITAEEAPGPAATGAVED